MGFSNFKNTNFKNRLEFEKNAWHDESRRLAIGIAGVD